MKTIIVAIAALVISGCAMTPRQKHVTGIIVGSLAIGTLAAHGKAKPQNIAPPAGLPCHVQPDGSCR